MSLLACLVGCCVSVCVLILIVLGWFYFDLFGHVRAALFAVYCICYFCCLL